MSDDTRKRLGMVIRQEREGKNLSQEALAFECGLHRTYIGAIERGERNLCLLNIIRIAEALGSPASDLLRKAGL